MAAPKLADIRVSAVTPLTDRGDILDQAGAILILLANAYEADAEANSLAIVAAKPNPDWCGLNPTLFANALKGVASLIAVSRHLEGEASA